MIIQETYALSNGNKIPKVGFGTYLIDNEDVTDAVKSAIDIGYRHIDTAQAYQNEKGVGKAIADSGLNREDIYITTKIEADIKSYEEAAQSIEQSLEDLQTDYIDLIIIHNSRPWGYEGDDRFFEGNQQVWKAMEEAYNDGKLKAIGVSNFNEVDIKNIWKSCTIKPMVNQILAHIGNTPHELIQFCQENDILIQAYSPIGHGKLLDNQEAAKIAKKYSVTLPQLGIRYDLQLSLLPLPKSSKPNHIKSNTELDFEISEEDMEMLRGM